MKRILISLVCLFACLQITLSQQPELRFNKDGTFKIVQFTDVHFIYQDPRSNISLERISEVLDHEKPDLVIFTGDIVFAEPAKEGMETVLNLVAKRNIPFGVTFGNHDDEHDLSRTQLLELVQTIPGNVSSTVPGISGTGNYILPVKSANGKKEAAILYCLDSHAYSSIEGVDGYDYIKFDQIQWYRENSMRFTQANGGTPLPSLAFFHIPLPEYNQAAADEKAILIGTRKEKACAPQLNTGMFAAMKERGDIMGMFVGHDHDCDYVVNWKGILLGYGRYSGGNTVYNNLPNGARVFKLTEGERGFKTWIHLKDNEIVQRVTYPDDFIKK
ncbi:MAG: metallophosphoesterase family protein [Tannerellaceae bacterium]|nr:metallophosphoesterase family protein [Tannerellaceae bacterium]